MPDQLRSAQKVFASTGGLHGAALFTADGAVLAVREDVGRHNAVDKVIGWALETRALPLAGRAPGQRPGVVRAHPEGGDGRHPGAGGGLGAVLAGRRLAEEAGLTLVAFLRGDSMNVYSRPDRIKR